MCVSVRACVLFFVCVCLCVCVRVWCGDCTTLAHANVCQAKTILMVATRVIDDGEELFVDYRLPPNKPHPAWYHPVDPRLAERIAASVA